VKRLTMVSMDHSHWEDSSKLGNIPRIHIHNFKFSTTRGGKLVLLQHNIIIN